MCSNSWLYSVVMAHIVPYHHVTATLLQTVTMYVCMYVCSYQIYLKCCIILTILELLIPHALIK
jgi:hypothetical protein